MRHLSPALLAAAAAIASAPAARADYGVRPIWNDFQPAVSTERRPPDGGRRYNPPNTRLLVREGQRSEYDGSTNDPRVKSSRPLPPGTSTNPATKPPDQVGR